MTKKKTQRWTIKNIGAEMKKTAKNTERTMVSSTVNCGGNHKVRRRFLKFKLET